MFSVQKACQSIVPWLSKLLVLHFLGIVSKNGLKDLLLELYFVFVQNLAMQMIIIKIAKVENSNNEGTCYIFLCILNINYLYFLKNAHIVCSTYLSISRKIFYILEDICWWYLFHLVIILKTFRHMLVVFI